MTTPLSRRHFLRSNTALIALPVLQSLGFRRFASAAATAPATPPKRLVFLGFGWGITTETWFPDINQPGPDYTLPEGLKPLARHKADFSIVQGLWNKHTHDGHAGSTWWLTGANRFEQPGQTFHNSISADQVAAAQLGLQTRFASLQLNHSEENDRSGHGPGLSMAWDISGKPVGGHKGPLEAYHRLFSSDNTPIEQQKAMLAQKRSVLDTVLENANDLKRGLSKTDTAKLDEYFQGIRDIETRLSKDEQWIGVPPVKAPIPEPQPGLAGREEIKIMYDLMVAAMQTDSTRVLTYRQPVGSLLTSLDIKVAPHDMSHYHSTMGEKHQASQRRDLVQSELLAGFIDKLKSTAETDGTRLFDHVALAYGSNIRTEHDLDNCPTLITGGGAGLKLGHNIVVSEDTPLCNAWLTMLHGLGVKAERHGDSSGTIKEMVA
ncbi:DUF1552 domain-containing protein [Phragmitibacter flavus]|uniref:DUF1552 domain-containing protein n=1 Tax=Phragmitibacter flavus TaxID=2576071 RepID=A0A5R8KEY5_9BACT|nr:DUF1552 domain-containing protein [Phragmitibacter flavus]TLD70854.1 DUF1552 domain-containing protein [Phragmitibacter flavus]